MVRPTRGGYAFVEILRLIIVILLTAGGFAIGPTIAPRFDTEPETTRLVCSVLGALLGYLLGGVIGRSVVRGVASAEERMARVDATELVTALIGSTLMALFGMAVLWPVLLLPNKEFTVPFAMAVLASLMYAGGRFGAARGGDFLRFLGVRGRIEVSSPSKGQGAKIVDTSALIDGRLAEVARAGFLEGTLVIPRFVLVELQGIADAEDPRRRNAGRRGLDTLRVLQEDRVVAIEVTDDEAPLVADVDGKLAAIARERNAHLITVDSNLARVAEISGVQVLNLHALADSLRPPVSPGERLTVVISKVGREAGQGVGYLPDGTMVVVERAAPSVGASVTAEVTSLMQTRNGRMVFAGIVDPGSAEPDVDQG